MSLAKPGRAGCFATLRRTAAVRRAVLVRPCLPDNLAPSSPGSDQANEAGAEQQ
jgi:hypothetical protein